VVRIGPQECSIDDPNSVKTLYGIGSKFVKADWYYASSSPHFEHLKLFALRDPEQHSSLKKKLARFYTMTYVTNYEDAVDRNVLTFCERLQAFSQKGETFDLGHWVQCLAFDVISEITVS
jgi:cytochrome P450